MTDRARVAWLFPSLWLGHYWHPVFAAFEQRHPDTVVWCGGVWDNFDPGQPGTRLVEQVGDTGYHRYGQTDGYSRQFMLPSPRILAKLLRHRPAVVLSQAFSLWTLAAALLKPLGRWRLVLFIDGSSPNVDFLDSKLRTLQRRVIARAVDRYVSNSEGAKDYLVDVLGADPDDVEIVRYLVPDPAYLARSQGEPPATRDDRTTFLYVGKLIPRKGFTSLLEACRALVDRGTTAWELVVVGDGTQRDELERLATSYGLDEHLRWEGWVDASALGPYYRAADVFVFPTWEDIWGIVPLEAMAFGLPVVGSAHAGSSEMIDGDNGVVVDPKDTRALADAMAGFVDDPARVERMAKAALDTTAANTPQRAAEQFADVVDRLAG